MKHLWIILGIAIVGSITPVQSASDKTGDEVDSLSSSFSESQNKTAAKSTKKSKKPPKKTPKLPATRAEKSENERVISNALKPYSRLQKLKLNDITRFVRKNKIQLTILIAVALFRKDILRLSWRLISKPVTNPDTGSTQRILAFSPMRIVQFLFVLALARRLQQPNENGNSSVSPLTAALVMGRYSNPVLAIFLSKFLSPESSVYLPSIKQHFTFENINERYIRDLVAYKKATRANNFPSQASSNVTAAMANVMQPTLNGNHASFNEAIVVMDWTSLDSSVSRMDVMRDEVSFLIKSYETQTNSGDSPRFQEVVVLLESQGGSAADYSLASQQILRLRRKGIKVTMCVDKVAASGGYMIACASSPGCLLAAPFAVLGSIGVLGQTINIQKTLEGWGIRPLVFKGGKDKAPVGLIGDVTRDGMAKVQQMIDKTHVAFKQHVSACRPMVASAIEEIATGDIWLGYDALGIGLVDRITTSDEYIGEKVSEGAIVLKLVQMVKGRSFFQKATTSSEIHHKDVLYRKSSHAAQDLEAIINGVRKGLSLLQDDDETLTWARHLGTDIQLDSCNQRC
ncbi:hypothetical protein FisN_21Lh165 [Fistulifera solaris]|uniref:Peptidase S49 domain-containing protein n=1 Tax=Fistulifera solaris TaxID=1519565 RepID=A0A1Z5J9H9_FISSO|nr:hypothetical protein FisN_21Lh165 [Fistulifera solaris]|eukprot:GAX10468.1 hypothetical protein FisN_21Lh165 [Fistulifera solaris]